MKSVSQKVKFYEMAAAVVSLIHLIGEQNNKTCPYIVVVSLSLIDLPFAAEVSWFDFPARSLKDNIHILLD